MELATKSACTACHAIDKKLVGPSYQEVAAKYKGNAKATRPCWSPRSRPVAWARGGQVTMPPNAAVDADIATLVKWILAGAK